MYFGNQRGTALDLVLRVLDQVFCNIRCVDVRLTARRQSGQRSVWVLVHAVNRCRRCRQQPERTHNFQKRRVEILAVDKIDGFFLDIVIGIAQFDTAQRASYY